MNNDDSIELKSEYLKDVLGTPPHWLLCTGSTILFITLIFLFTGSVLFKHPTIIESPVEIVTSKPVASIVAANTGIISELFVADSQHVDKGQFIAVIQNSANYKDIITLEKLLPKYDSLINNKQFLFELPSKLQLGEIQSDYLLLDSKLQNYQHYIFDDYHLKEIKAANKKSNYLIDYKAILQNKLFLRKKKVNLLIADSLKIKKCMLLVAFPKLNMRQVNKI